MGWLYSRDVPKLTQMMLNEFPALRNDDGMMRSYCFVLDFLEAVVKETSTMLYKNRRTLKLILEAAKISEQEVDRQMNLLLEDVIKQYISLYN
jgi:small nuclear ribonucleoprotein (snRNP)-like protein